jgi:hypothetical protein
MEGLKLKGNPADLKTGARKILAAIPPEDMKQMLAKGRWTCESNWMMAMVMAAGWDTVNAANLEVGKAVAKVEMHRLMRLLGLNAPRNDEQFVRMIMLAMECFITEDYWDYEARYAGPGQMLAIIHKCYAYAKIHSIGVDKDYQCGCFGLRDGWYAAMGIEAEEKLTKCLKDGDEQCEILVEIKSFGADVKENIIGR